MLSDKERIEDLENKVRFMEATDELKTQKERERKKRVQKARESNKTTLETMQYNASQPIRGNSNHRDTVNNKNQEEINDFRHTYGL